MASRVYERSEMRIQSKSGDATYGARQRKMERAKAATAAAMKDLAAKRSAAGAKSGEGRVGGVHIDAVMEAINQEGPEVMSQAASGWWEDQKRLNPWMCADGVVPDGNSPNGRYGRHGKVRERYVAGRGWEHWDPSVRDWVPGEIGKRKGIR